MRKNHGKTILKIILFIIVIATIAVLAFVYKKKSDEKHQEQLNALQYEIDSSKQIIYVALADIKAGELLELDVNVTEQQVLSGLDSYMYISEDDLGRQALVDIEEGLPIMVNMVSGIEITNDTRVYDTDTVVMMADQSDYDVVDVRVMFPDGQDFLVLTKKTIDGVNLETARFNMMLNEEEILRFKCALVDAYMVSGTKLYTVRYIEPSIQEAGIPNYPVRNTTLTLIKEDPNVATYAELTLSAIARQTLEGKLEKLSSAQLDAVASGNNVTDNANSSVLLQGSHISDEFIIDSNAGTTDNTAGY